MAKIDFVKTSELNKLDWYSTEIDGLYVSNSGSCDYQQALDKFNILSAGGSLEPIKTILKTHELNEEN